MKRHGNLWSKIVARENIEEAIKRASKHKNSRPTVKWVKKHKEEIIDNITDMLENETYVVSPYIIKAIHEPKLRLTYTLPFYPDGILFHCFMNILEPIWDNLFIYDSYSCRVGKGQHRGMQKCCSYVKKYKYCLKCDISQFYPSLNHDILKSIIRRKIKDEKVLRLIDVVIDSISVREANLLWLNGRTTKGASQMVGKLEFLKTTFPSEACGVPIGNYPSQWFGNLYMNELDMYIKHELGVEAYVRYCDDFVLFSNDKATLHRVAECIDKFLFTKLKLYMSKRRVFPTSLGVDFLGYRMFHNGVVLLRKGTAKRVKRRIKKLWHKIEVRNVDYDSDLSVIASTEGWLGYANSHNFSRVIQLAELKKELKRRKIDERKA